MNVLKHSIIHFNIHPFVHLAFILSVMYAKVSCDESYKHKNIYKHSLFISPSLPLHLSFLSLFLQPQNSLVPQKLISLGPYATGVFERQLLALSALVVLMEPAETL